MQEKCRLLVVDQSYSPIESLENEELYRHGIFEWNISRIIKYIERNEWERWSSPPCQGSKESCPVCQFLQAAC